MLQENLFNIGTPTAVSAHKAAQQLVTWMSVPENYAVTAKIDQEFIRLLVHALNQVSQSH